MVPFSVGGWVDMSKNMCCVVGGLKKVRFGTQFKTLGSVSINWPKILNNLKENVPHSALQKMSFQPHSD